MFNGYYSQEYHGWAVVGYQDERGNFKPIQKFYNSSVDTENRRGLLYKGCHESEEVDPVAKARDLVGMLNGGRDFHRVANALEDIARNLGRLCNIQEGI